MTGNLELAKQAYEIDAKHWNKKLSVRKTQFRHIGSGGTREAYLGPDGYVYKVGDEECNLREAKASRQLRNNRRLGNLGVVVPRARTYRVDGGYWVCAMDYVPTSGQLVECNSYDGEDWFEANCNCGKRGKPRVCFGKVMKFLDDFGIEDMFSGNIIYSTDNRFHLIDLGFQGADLS